MIRRQSDKWNGKLTGSKHRIQQQHPPIRNILGQLIIKQLRLTRLLIPLNENLPNAYRTTAIPQSLFHSLAGTHDGNATDLALELNACIGAADRGGDGVLDDGKMVETFFDEETDDPVGVEDEICAIGGLRADHAEWG